MSFLESSIPTAERWQQLSLNEQLANVGADIDRVIRWRARGNFETGQKVFERALELLNLTLNDSKIFKTPARWELLRVREALVDYFMYDNEYGSSDELWSKYFYFFSFRAAKERERRMLAREK